MPEPSKWNKHWTEIALTFAKLSKDPITKVGSVIVTSDNRQCSGGYNGFARGIDENDSKWQRPTKYLYAVHSEENAILNCPFDVNGCKIYVTLQPCHRCLIRLLNAGIKEVYYLSDYANLEHKDIWLEHAKNFDIIQQL